MYSTRSVGSCFKRTRRSVGQSFSLRATHRRTQVPAPCVSSRGPGGNRTCLTMYSTTAVERVSYVSKGPTRVWPENSGEPLLGHYVTQRRHVPVGLAPTSPDPMYSEPAVGLYSMGDEVMARAMLYPLSYVPQVLRKSGRMDSNQQPMYSNRQSPFCFSSRPNEVVTETFHFQ